MILRVGSRDSRLAVRQAEIVIDAIKRVSELETKLITMKTSGDMAADSSLDTLEGKGLFTRKLDRALFEERIDMAVHSLKDMPADLERGLRIAAFISREDPRDALVLPLGRTEMAASQTIGCAGKRRSIQLGQIFPEWSCAFIHGNVPTRLEKLDRGEYGALVLAAAGLKRLGLAGRIHRFFEPEELLPAAGQGILAVVSRDPPDGELSQLLLKIDEAAVRRAALAERSFTRTLDGGCGTPIAAFAQEVGKQLILQGFYAPVGDGATSVRGVLSGPRDQGAELGRELAYRLLAESARKAGKLGKVYLVGAGPGDRGLLTIKAAEILKNAQTVVFDKLTGKGILAQISAKAEKIDAGKESGSHTLEQEAINDVLVKKASEGCIVLRLKGGDPYLFGRGGEEAQCLARTGIPFEVVPGVSSSLAVPACAGIPLTHREFASCVHIISGHNAYSAQNNVPGQVDYPALVKTGGSLIFLMGMANIAAISQNLLGAGLSPDTPAAVIEEGTTAHQKKLLSDIAHLPMDAQRSNVKAPAVIVVGEVTRLSEILSSPAKPLTGLRIAVTRPKGSASQLSALLTAEGAEVLEIPSIEIVPIVDTPLFEEALNTLTNKHWFAFTSANSVEVFFEKLREYRKDIRTLAPCKFAAAKHAAVALESRGIIPSLVPKIPSGEGLGNELAQRAAKDETVIFLRSAIGFRTALEPLTAAGIAVLDFPIYNILDGRGFENSAYRGALLEGLDWVTFTSVSTVESFIRIFKAEKSRYLQALCIGMPTAAAAEWQGFPVLMAEEPTPESMTTTLVKRQAEMGSFRYPKL